MNFHEIEKYKVSVNITKEDLAASDIQIDDILERSGSGWEYLRQIRKSAVEFTGYEWPGCAFSMEMRVCTDGGVIVIFSETIADFIKGLKNSQIIADHGSILLRELIKRIEEADDASARRIIRDFEQSVRDVRI